MKTEMAHANGTACTHTSVEHMHVVAYALVAAAEHYDELANGHGAVAVASFGSCAASSARDAPPLEMRKRTDLAPTCTRTDRHRMR